jgi:hypothetical protein
MPVSKPKAKAAASVPAEKPVDQRGKEYNAERLTGNRIQKGIDGAGRPRYLYEVKWAGCDPKTQQPWKNTFEPPTCLIGWEEQMKRVDEAIQAKINEPQLNPAKKAQEEREAKARAKAQELEKKKERLQRLQQRRLARGGINDEDQVMEEEEEEAEEGEEELSLEQLGNELERLTQLGLLVQQTFGQEGGPSREQLEKLFTAFGADATAVAAAAQMAAQQPAAERPAVHAREGRSRVWIAFDRVTNRCTLKVNGHTCGAPPKSGSGTSGYIRHLEECHMPEWLEIKRTGCKPIEKTIEDAMAAKTDQTKPALPEKDAKELDRLVAFWIAKNGRPQVIVDDTELENLLARILDLCKARYRYELPSEPTVHRELMLLGAEGKSRARNFCVGLLKSGVKISITGDLWSSNGMGLFGMYAHGISNRGILDDNGNEVYKWEVEKMLIGLVACEDERHTSENIQKWTKEALEGIGLKPDSLLESGAGSSTAPLDMCKLTLSSADFMQLGVDKDATDANVFVFKKVSDNGSNIKSAWTEDGYHKWAPCVCHTLELCTLPITHTMKKMKDKDQLADPIRGSVQESFTKARGIVGYLHHSTIAESDFHACQQRVGLEQTKIDQDVRTRWRTSHSMAEQLVYNKEAVLEMDKNPAYKNPGETWGKNKLSFTNWDHLEEGAAVLYEASLQSQFLEGDLYPTISWVIPGMFRLMAYSAPSHNVYFANRDEDEYNDNTLNPVVVPHNELDVKIQEARTNFHQQLIDRFDSDLPLEIKQFLFIASMLDPRTKKLTFEGDTMMKPALRKQAERWLKMEYDANYKGKVQKPAAVRSSSVEVQSSSSDVGKAHVKRRKVSSASLFAARVPGQVEQHNSQSEVREDGSDSPHEDELAVYLDLPQIENTGDWSGLNWWADNQKRFPNLAQMARQYMGCPASSATVERLFSVVGIAFSDKRKRASSSTLESLAFAQLNL